MSIVIYLDLLAADEASRWAAGCKRSVLWEKHKEDVPSVMVRWNRVSCPILPMEIGLCQVGIRDLQKNPFGHAQRDIHPNVSLSVRLGAQVVASLSFMLLTILQRHNHTLHVI